jgi:hypothetical protein
VSTPEGKVKSDVDKQLAAGGAYKHKPVMNGMGAPALDYHVCHRGFYAGIETKAPGKHPTVRQIRTMREVLAAGGSLFLIDHGSSVDFAQLVGWMLNPVPGFISTSAKLAIARKPDDDKCNDGP